MRRFSIYLKTIYLRDVVGDAFIEVEASYYSHKEWNTHFYLIFIKNENEIEQFGEEETILEIPYDNVLYVKISERLDTPEDI